MKDFFKLKDHFGNDDILVIGEIEKDHQVVDLTISNDTDFPIRITLNRNDLINLVEHLEGLIEKMDI